MTPEIGCYYFPNYHTGDPWNEKLHSPGWNEWRLAAAAQSRFPGHVQPRLPLRSFTDEKDPAVMADNIRLASGAGIGSFIFDWYYYDDGPFLNRALEEGFFRAENPGNFKFCTMWANHDWVDIHPCSRFGGKTDQYPAAVFRGPRISRIRSQGDRAAAITDDRFAFQLRRVEGRWYIECVPGLEALRAGEPHSGVSASR